MHSSLGVTLLVYVEQYSGRNYSSLSVRNWTTKKERSITKSWKNTRIVESEKCFRIETEAAVCTTCCSRWSGWFPGRSRKSAWVEIYRIRAVLDSHSFDSLFRVHEKSVSRRRHRVYAALSLHYIIPLCSRARLFATSVPRTLGIDDSFARCLRYRLTVARIFSLKFLLFLFLVLAESIVITIIIIIIKFYH